MRIDEVPVSPHVGRRLVGWYIEGDYEEPVQIEYRFAVQNGFDVRTHIRGQEYHAKGQFFLALAAILDQLPLNSAIKIIHMVIISDNGADRVTQLEEWFMPYANRKPGQPVDTGTVVYKLRLLVEDEIFEGYGRTDFGNAAEELRRNLEPRYIVKTCYFCTFLVEFNDWGGTDYRHDQLFCFRDQPDALQEIQEQWKRHQRSQRLGDLLDRFTNTLAEVDALHSCSSFEYEDTPRP